ncbi:hypothetical protein HMJ29_07380 [Hymenobacter taeanensis]|uniref:Phosphoribosylpyrophosphate synthetase n=1 Tax=Hymenobacter taeanensis TaxID=2735321 RepID=A0A6M6BFL8_9BACT|nr:MULTISPECIES: hypothetical protein [Hymenobacter]QJX46769.1 hypothetical protein HMJ29_07380 [Hymenobacter taeanensis]UOQ80638.1 hypothetical protein MUN83_17725 [Hymenobacter sp. 5414T-23]
MQDKEEERSLVNVERKLSQDGFTADFRVTDGRLHTMDTERDKSYGPNEVTIVDFYRFEGESDPDDMSILYALETTDGVRGTISSAYGTYGDSDALEFLKQVEDLGKNLSKSHK